MKATVKVNCLPIGQYRCEFEGIEQVESEQYGPGWKWRFTVTAGKHRDRECTRFTGDSPSPKNACGRFLAALAGMTPHDGLEIDTDNYVGSEYFVLIQATANGDSTRVESFVPVQSEEDDTLVAPAPDATPAAAPAGTDKVPF